MGKTPKDIKIDRISFQLGMINCFVEMVACGVKKLALSPPIFPEDYEVIEKFSDGIVKGFGIKSYLEKSLLVTDLQPAEFTRGKWAILYYEDNEILKAYLALKEKKRQFEKSGQYDKDTRKSISREFGRLLSYPEVKIEEKISRETPSTPFMIIKD
jgi:hypothetical protein